MFLYMHQFYKICLKCIDIDTPTSVYKYYRYVLLLEQVLYNVLWTLCQQRVHSFLHCLKLPFKNYGSKDRYRLFFINSYIF